jgi:CrcB protein
MFPAMIPKLFAGTMDKAREYAAPGRNVINPMRGTSTGSAMNKYWMVGMGGFVGAIARFWLGGFISDRLGARFPYGTFVINISGSFLIGLVVTLLAGKTHWNANWRYLIPIGFIGAYTTFSTFELETFQSLRDGELFFAFLNVFLSVVLGFIAVWLGVITGRTIG